MKILMLKRASPFREHRVVDYFLRIEFQNRGSPHAHILLWLENAPQDILGQDKDAAIQLIDKLISVSSASAPNNIHLQKHKHTFTCFKKLPSNHEIDPNLCRFDIPFFQ